MKTRVCFISFHELICKNRVDLDFCDTHRLFASGPPKPRTCCQVFLCPSDQAAACLTTCQIHHKDNAVSSKCLQRCLHYIDCSNSANSYTLDKSIRSGHMSIRLVISDQACIRQISGWNHCWIWTRILDSAYRNCMARHRMKVLWHGT